MKMSPRSRSFLTGICIGLLVNSLYANSLLAATSASADAPVGPPQEIQEYDRSDLIDANRTVCETLFPGDVWDHTTTLSVSSDMISEGRNDGVSSDGGEFRLQAFVVDEFSVSELAASLTQAEQDLWTSGNVSASVFVGLISSEDTGYSVAMPVVGWASSSMAYPDAKITIMEILQPEDAEAMLDLWLTRAFEISEGEGSAQGDWEFWYEPCVYPADLIGGDGDPCIQKRIDCGNEFDSNMRFAVASLKAVMATAGTGCVVGAILTGAFCLVGALGCGVFTWVASRCAYVLGTAVAAFLGAIVACRIAYEMCMGACLGNYGCP